MTRREFMIGVSAIAAVRRRSTVRIRIVGARGRRGADLGFEEAARTAKLLGWMVDESTGGDAVAIQLDEGRLVADGVPFHIAASAAARQAAVERWNREHGAGGHDAIEWHPALQRFGATQLNERFSRRFGSEMDAPAWVGWMLVKIPVEAALRSIDIDDGRFDGHKGRPLTFGPDRRLVQPLCVVDEKGALLGIG